MQEPAETDDEPERLEALRATGVLDTAPEEDFDTLTYLARRLLSVPVALVSLIDQQRQWFKARVGLDMRELPRWISFCGHTIHGADVFHIPDATQDERFCDNPLVVGEPGIRFYAGHPIHSSGGHALGTLCIIDYQPRTLDADEQTDLRMLASLATHEMQVRELALTDDLTGLPNRRGFLALADRALGACKREGSTAVLLLCDLDGFKAINDNHGHASGDAALQRFADALLTSVRRSDACGRLGGDEFAVLLMHTGETDAHAFLERLNKAVDATGGGAGPPALHWSAGFVGLDPARHDSITDLLVEADHRMYRDKRARPAR